MASEVTREQPGQGSRSGPAVQRAAQQAAEAEQRVRSTIDTTLDGLNVSGNDRALVLTLADRFLVDRFGQPLAPDAASPEQIQAAIRRGHAEFQNVVQRHAEQYLKSKAETHGNLPAPLTGGNASGGEAVPEPTTMKEAKERVRKAIGL